MKFCLSKDIQKELNELNPYRYKVKRMTREEAIKKCKYAMSGVSDYGLVDFFIEAGMLKVEEEKTVEEKAANVLKELGVQYPTGVNPAGVIQHLINAGLKIVEK